MKEEKKQTVPKTEPVKNTEQQRQESPPAGDNNTNTKQEVAKPVTKKKKRRLGFKFGVTLISVVNLLILGSIFFILSAASDKAKDLKTLRNASIGAEEKGKVESGDLEIESVIQKYDYLKALFPDEIGLVEFVKEIEKLKTEGSVKDFSFANQDAVKDKTKAVGIPFILRMVGSWEDIDRDLTKLQTLPYLTRAVTLDIRLVGETEKQVDFRYGGFIYVDQSLEKNK